MEKKIDMLKLADDLSRLDGQINRLKDIDADEGFISHKEELRDKRNKEIEDFEEEREIEKYTCFISAMLQYFCNVNGKEMAKDLFDVEINDWDKDDGGSYHSGNFQIMQKDLYRFLCKCDDKRRRAIAIQSMKYLRGEK